MHVLLLIRGWVLVAHQNQIRGQPARRTAATPGSSRTTSAGTSSGTGSSAAARRRACRRRRRSRLALCRCRWRCATVPSRIAIGITPKIRKRCSESVELPVRVVHRVGQRIVLVHFSPLLGLRPAENRTPGIGPRRTIAIIWAWPTGSPGWTSSPSDPWPATAWPWSHDADGVSDETMLALAQETRLSETTFVQSTEAEGADYRNRIWDPHEELPFAGHPSLGHRRRRGALARPRRSELRAGDRSRPAADRGPEGERELAGLDASERGRVRPGARPRRGDVRPSASRAEDAHPELAPQVVSTGCRT